MLSSCFSFSPLAAPQMQLSKHTKKVKSPSISKEREKKISQHYLRRLQCAAGGHAKIVDSLSFLAASKDVARNPAHHRRVQQGTSIFFQSKWQSCPVLAGQRRLHWHTQAEKRARKSFYLTGSCI
jgi:hypothetical protein